jgi:Activator of Hsp90 ATPase homolog 1-like protein
VVFEEEEDGGTRVTITQGPHTDKMLPLVQAGWEGSLDKLESLLAA